MADLNMQAVCQLTGLNPSTLRAWERRYGAIVPQRTDSGHRLYSYQDVERIRALMALVEKGHTISRLAELDRSELDKLTAISPRVDKPKSQLKPQRVARETQFENLMASLAQFELRALSLELARARLLYDVRTFVLNYVSPLLGEVGRRVHEGELSIAQEHALSAILRAQLGQMMQTMGNVPQQSDTKVANFVFTTPEGELHEFGILLGALLCNYWGLEVNYLGPNLPASPLSKAALALEAHYLVLGTSPFTPRLKEYLKHLDGELMHSCEILVGGPKAGKLTKSGLSHSVRGLDSLSELDQIFCSLSPNRSKR